MNNDIIRQLLGIIGMSFHGEYNVSTTYKRGHVVVYEGSSYVAKTTSLGNLPTNTNFFQLVAHKPVYGVDYFTDEEKRNLVQDVLDGVESELSDVALSGLYNDLINKPILSTVATSGSYNDLSNKPDLTIYATNQNLNNEVTNRQNSDTNLQNQIDAITISSDVVDIVGTYQNLQNYDTTKLTNDDIIKVLEDSTHNNALSYYRWHKTNSVGSWVYVGSEGPFYTKGETDTLLNSKQNVIDSSHKIISDNVDDSTSNNKFVTSSDKNNWNAKYTKPSNGIPKTDLVESVRSSLDKADSAVQDEDLTDYVKNTDYATSDKGGTIKVYPNYGLSLDDGKLRGVTRSYNDYLTSNSLMLISKVTLENVIAGKRLGSNTIAPIQNKVYFETIEPGIYYNNRNFSSVEFYKNDQESSLFSINSVSLLIVEKKYNDSLENNEDFAFILASDSYGLNRTIVYRKTNSTSGIGRLNSVIVTGLSTSSQTISGEKIFSTIPKQNDDTAPTEDTQFTNKKYVDDLVDDLVGDIGTILDNINGEVVGG